MHVLGQSQLTLLENIGNTIDNWLLRSSNYKVDLSHREYTLPKLSVKAYLVLECKVCQFLKVTNTNVYVGHLGTTGRRTAVSYSLVSLYMEQNDYDSPGAT